MGAYTEIVDFTFTANETSRTFSGLSITKDDFIKVVTTLTNGTSSGMQLRLFPNTTAGVSGFDTNTNYHLQNLIGSGTNVAAERANINFLTNVTSGIGNSSFAISYNKVSENGKFNIFTNDNFSSNSGLQNRFFVCTSSNLTFNDTITSLTLQASVTNAIGTGSRIQIYKLDAVKLADITVTSNTTQVDISNLSIDKDSEYLLVSEFINNSGGVSFYGLTPNDLTTLTGYHFQAIRGFGSTTEAIRANSNVIAGSVTANRVLGYQHIKLSNIGAYTLQSYTMQGMGTSGVQIRNDFISSTAENITSITKLNILASVTNGITAGSRFILYKLYE